MLLLLLLAGLVPGQSWAQLLSQNFATYPPTGWTEADGNINQPVSSWTSSVSSDWESDGFGNAGTSGAARINLYNLTRDWLISPSIDLGAGSMDYRLVFKAALTGYSTTSQASFGTTDTVYVVVSTDGGATWPRQNIIMTFNSAAPVTNGSTYTAYLTNFEGQVRLGFYASRPSGTTPDINFFVDDVVVEEIPTNPVFSANPASLAFGQTLLGNSRTMSTTITNTGGGSLTISDASSLSITGANASFFSISQVGTVGQTYPIVLGLGQSVACQVTYAPTAEGSHAASLDINTVQLGAQSVALTGSCADPTIMAIPHAQNFDGVTAPAFPLGWEPMVTTTSPTSALVQISNSTSPAPASSPNYVKFTSGADANASLMLVSPPIAEDLNLLKVKFKMYAGSYSFEVGVYTPDKAFQVIQTLSNGYSFQDQEVSLASYTGTGNRVAIRFVPAVPGEAVGTYRTGYIDNFALEYLPTEPVFAISPTTKDFGTVATGASAQQKFTITNAGVSTISLASASSVALAGTQASHFSIIDTVGDDGGAYPVVLAAGQSVAYTVVFTAPMTAMAINDAQLTVSTTTLGDFSAALMANVVDPALYPPFTETFSTFPPTAFWRGAEGNINQPTSTWLVPTAWGADGFGNAGTTGAIRVNIYGTTQDWIITPPIALGDGSLDYRMSFRAALTLYNNPSAATFGATDTVYVVVSTDNGATWPRENIIMAFNSAAPVTNGSTYTADLTDYSGMVRLGFYASRPTGITPDIDFFVDDLTVEEIPPYGVPSLSAESINFGQMAVGMASPEQKLVLSNTGTADLEIELNDIVLTGEFAVRDSLMDSGGSYPVTLGPGQKLVYWLSYEPQTAGEHLGSFTVTGDMASDETSLFGEAFELDEGVVQVGFGNFIGTSLPYEPYYGYSYSQSIYKSAEFASAAGEYITGMWYHFIFNSTDAFTPFTDSVTVYLSVTELETLTGFAPLGESVKVFSHQINITEADTWVYLEFDYPYLYDDAVGNLLVSVEEDESGYHSTSHEFIASAVEGNRSAVFFSDSNNPNPDSPPTAGLRAYIPNTRFQFEDLELYGATFLVEDQSGTPIEGAEVMAAARAIATDAAGEAVVAALEPGDYSYTVTMAGYFPAEGSFTIVDADVAVPITLEPIPTYVVDLTVVDGEENAIEGAAVAFGTMEATTDATGAASFEGVEPGTYALSISAEGYETFSQEVVVVDQDLELTANMMDIIEHPYGPGITVEGTSAHFTWNPEGEFTEGEFMDDFSAGNLDQWLDVVEGDATPGEATGIPYFHINTELEQLDVNWGFDIDTRIISPEMTVNDGASLTFAWATSYYWFVDPYDNSDLSVEVSTDGGQSWTTAWTEEDAGVFANYTWYETTLDLSDFAGLPMHFSFHVVGDDNADVYMDDVEVGYAKAFGSRAIGLTGMPQNAKRSASMTQLASASADKAFNGFTVLLNDAVAATGLTATEHNFSDLPAGTHTAGVFAAYSSGNSDTAEVEFTIEEPTYTVSIHVMDADMDGIEGATVNFGDWSATSGADGWATFEGILDGDYDYTVTLTGYETESGTITVDGADIEEHVTMTPGQSTVSIVFNCDMNAQIDGGAFDPEADFLDMAGTLNNWGSGDAIVLADEDGDGVYTATVAGFVPGALVSYKYRLNGNWDTSEFPNGGPNRDYTVTEASPNIVNDVYNNGNIVAVSSLNELGIRMFPNPATHEVNFANVAGANIELFNLLGQRVLSVNNAQQSHVLSLDGLNSGTYMVRVSRGGEVSTARLVVVR